MKTPVATHTLHCHHCRVRAIEDRGRRLHWAWVLLSLLGFCLAGWNSDRAKQTEREQHVAEGMARRALAEAVTAIEVAQDCVETLEHRRAPGRSACDVVAHELGVTREGVAQACAEVEIAEPTVMWWRNPPKWNP